MVRNKGARYASLVAAGVLAFGALAACGDDSDRAAATATAATAAEADGKVGVILPDTTTSPRWEANDRPSLEAAFDDAGVESIIQNAGGDVAKFGEICDSMINEGVTVLMIVNLDSESGKACLTKADRRRRPEHRLRPAHPRWRRVVLRVVRQRRGRRADGHRPASTASTTAGKTKANIVYINGDPTDNNAALFKQGYEEALAAEDRLGRLHARR